MYFTYILASKKHGTLYIGVTNDLVCRVAEHRQGNEGSFSSSYKVTMLVHYDAFDDIEQAISREKKLKHWKRDWKVNLIEEDNPNWDDLYPGII